MLELVLAGRRQILVKRQLSPPDRLREALPIYNEVLYSGQAFFRACRKVAVQCRSMHSHYDWKP
jgi:hypothetical protein